MLLQDYDVSIRKHLDENLDNNKSILDLGCSSGNHIKNFKKVVGIDIDADTARKYPHKVIIHDLTLGIPLKNNTFDQILCLELLEHFKDINQAELLIKECHRVLKKGGTIIVHTPNRSRWTLRLRDFVGKPKKYPWLIARNPGRFKEFTHLHYHEFTKNELGKIFTDAGYTEVEVHEQFIELPFILKGMDVTSSFGKALFVVARK